MLTRSGADVSYLGNVKPPSCVVNGASRSLDDSSSSQRAVLTVLITTEIGQESAMLSSMFRAEDRNWDSPYPACQAVGVALIFVPAQSSPS